MQHDRFEHLVTFFLDNLKPEADREVVLSMLMAALDDEYLRGLEEGADLCDEVASRIDHAGRKHAVKVMASSIRDLAAKNAADAQKSLHTW